MIGLNQDRIKLLTAPDIAANGERAERVAMITLAAGQKTDTLRLADFQKILPGHFHRGLNGFRTARDEIDPIHACWCLRYQMIGQLFHRLIGEKPGMGECDPVNLCMHGRVNGRMIMAKTRDRRTAACIKITLASLVDQIDAIALDSDRVLGFEIAVEDPGHRTLRGFRRSGNCQGARLAPDAGSGPFRQ